MKYIIDVIDDNENVVDGEYVIYDKDLQAYEKFEKVCEEVAEEMPYHDRYILKSYVEAFYCGGIRFFKHPTLDYPSKKVRVRIENKSSFIKDEYDEINTSAVNPSIPISLKNYISKN